MTGNEIRKKFLDFFVTKEHTIVESDSLVPKDDPTVLFTTAGMQQFKRQFLGNIDDYSKAATSQKCLRTDDLDEVGKSDFHHTFFEMLGNFSFGDYFKKEAIVWGWEFLTKELDIAPEKLWVSVYNDDSEAEDIWLNVIGIPKDKCVRLGDHSNFWPADAKENGPNGPCGPCSEIFYDYGVNDQCTNKKCDPDCDCGRFSEIWNLVFTQYNRKEGGELEPLPSKNIDTGMGLERLTAVIQGKKNNYETDLFSTIIESISALAEKENINIKKNETYIIADHMKAVVFGIADGVIPSNEGRGYVIKRLIIAMNDIILQAGAKKSLIYKIVPSVIKTMEKPYPYLTKKGKDISQIIEKIEVSYMKVRNEKIPELSDKIETLAKSKTSDKAVLLGELIFTYRDTYGLTLPTIKLVLDSKSIDPKTVTNALKTYDECMKKQQDQSRAFSKMSGDVFLNANLDLGKDKTEFVGYDQAKCQSKVLRLFSNQTQVDKAKTDEEVQVVLDKSPFYAESGGQVGDAGILKTDQGKIQVYDTLKMDNIWIHAGKVVDGQIKVGDQIQAEIDSNRRLSIMRNHTATHLLQAALREILGSHVQQQGSLVNEDKLRFDFTHPKAISSDEIMQIEDRVNGIIMDCEKVDKEILSIEEARNSGALAFFEEKYGKVVRIISIGDKSKEFCGGTHLDITGEIGLFKIVGESAIAQGIRRLEAKTGSEAISLIHNQTKVLNDIAKLIKFPVNEISNRIKEQSKRIKILEKDIGQLALNNIKNSIDPIIESSENKNGTIIIAHTFQNVDMSLLRKISDLIKQKAKSCIMILGAHSQDNASLLIAVTDDMIKKGIKANELIKKIAPLMGGSGGGRPQLAQAGSKETAKIQKAIDQANKIVKEKMNQ